MDDGDVLQPHADAVLFFMKYDAGCSFKSVMVMGGGKIKHCVRKVRRDLALIKKNATLKPQHVIDGDFGRDAILNWLFFLTWATQGIKIKLKTSGMLMVIMDSSLCMLQV